MMDFETEVVIAERILGQVLADHSVPSLALVRRGAPEDYFNGLCGLDADGNLIGTPFMVMMVGETKEDCGFLWERSLNFDWGPLVEGLRQRGLPIVHVIDRY